MAGVKGTISQKMDAAVVDRARTLWMTGISTALIGEKMGRTKSSICSIARRYNFPMRGSPIKAAGEPRVARERAPRRDTKPKPKPAPVAPVPPPPSEPAKPRTIFKPRAATACCWPFGDPKKPGFRFCVAEATPGKPYCQEHCDRAYRNPAASVMPEGAPLFVSPAAWAGLRPAPVEREAE